MSKESGCRTFFEKNAIEFTKKNQSVTYLVFSKDNGEMLGYFTLALKPLTIRGETVSNTTKRKLLRVSELDVKSDTYTMSAYLIAQLGKNYADGRNREIAGKELIELAWMIIEKTQYMFGGMVTFLEKRKNYYRFTGITVSHSLIHVRLHREQQNRMSLCSCCACSNTI